MQLWRCPPRRGAFARFALACSLAFLLAGCADEEAIDEATTVSLATPSPDLGVTRDRDVAWIYHLSKSHATDDLVARLEHERQRLASDKAAAQGSQPFNLLATEPPQAAAPPVNASASAPGSLATNPATPKPDDPLARVPAEQLDPAIVLALYHIDPVTYKQLFIDNYPTTAEGVQHDFGDRLVKAKLTKDGENYPIVALARYAATSDVAAAKLYSAAAVANDEIADRYAAVIAAFTKGHPGDLLPMLVRLEMPTRLATISEPAGWCRMKPAGVLDTVPDDPAQLALQRDLRSRLATCAAYLRKPDKRHVADRRSNRHPSKSSAPSVSKRPVPPA